MKKMKKIVSVIVSTCLLMGLLVACSSDSEEGTVRIVHKNYTEQRLLGAMLGEYLESKGFNTSVKELGGSMLCFNALNNGEADLYAEYTGTAYGSMLDKTDILPPQETYDYVKKEFEDKYDITWLKPLGFNNTYVLSVMPETAEKYKLEKISDLIPHSQDMFIGSDAEFAARTDGYPGLLEAYNGLEFKDIKSMDQGLTYKSLVDNKIDVNVSFSTDGRIAKYNLINLEDDQGYFPPYFCTPILKMDFAESNPEVVQALEELENKFTEEDMQKYNLMVDEGNSPEEVAKTMLSDKGLI